MTYVYDDFVDDRGAADVGSEEGRKGEGRRRGDETDS
jgi:hypothetical protein